MLNKIIHKKFIKKIKYNSNKKQNQKCTAKISFNDLVWRKVKKKENWCECLEGNT